LVARTHCNVEWLESCLELKAFSHEQLKQLIEMFGDETFSVAAFVGDFGKEELRRVFSPEFIGRSFASADEFMRAAEEHAYGGEEDLADVAPSSNSGLDDDWRIDCMQWFVNRIHCLKERGVELERLARRSLATESTVENRKELEKDLKADRPEPEPFGDDLSGLILEFLQWYRNSSTDAA
jgi:hypothetical protein